MDTEASAASLARAGMEVDLGAVATESSALSTRAMAAASASGAGTCRSSAVKPQASITGAMVMSKSPGSCRAISWEKASSSATSGSTATAAPSPAAVLSRAIWLSESVRESRPSSRSTASRAAATAWGPRRPDTWTDITVSMAKKVCSAPEARQPVKHRKTQARRKEIRCFMVYS